MEEKDTDRNRTEAAGDGISAAAPRFSGAGALSGSSNRITVIDETTALGRLSDGIRRSLEREYSAGDKILSGKQGSAAALRESGEQKNAALSDSGQPADAAHAEQGKKGTRRYQVINLMCELLRREDIAGTMKKFNMCTCGQCRAFVIARCLSSLPPKYIAVREDTASAEVSLYENEYEAAVKEALLKACSEVKEHPCHDERGES